MGVSKPSYPAAAKAAGQAAAVLPTGSGRTHAKCSRDSDLEHGNLSEAEAAARDLRQLDLSDALGLLEPIAEREPHPYERVALRWHGRLELERPGLTIAQAQLALSALGVLPADLDQAGALLRAIERPPRGRSARSRC